MTTNTPPNFDPSLWGPGFWFSRISTKNVYNYLFVSCSNGN